MIVFITEKINTNYGYHVGSLKKKAELMSGRNYKVGIRGALGTGYYFFGDNKDAKKYHVTKVSKANKKEKYEQGSNIYQIDLSKYNLFKPKNPVQFYDNLVVPVTNQIIKHLTVEDFEKKDIIDTLKDAADYYREMGVNIDDESFISITYNFVQDITKKSGSDDNFNTRVLKTVGYEGIDNRNSPLDDFNNSANVGSIIFDLKKDSIKQIN